MFKNSFWIQLKGTRTLYLPGAVTRMQKPAKRRAGWGVAWRGKAPWAPGPHTSTENPTQNPALRTQLSLCLCPFPTCSLRCTHRTPQHGRKRERKEIENHIDPCCFLLAVVRKYLRGGEKKLKVLNIKVLTDGWRAGYLGCP